MTRSRNRKKHLKSLMALFISLCTVLSTIQFTYAAPVKLSELSAGTVITIGGHSWNVLDPAKGYLQSYHKVGDPRGFDPDNTNIYNPTDSNNIAYYLNNTFYKSLTPEGQAMIQNHSWSIGNQTNENASSVTCKVGVISYSEFFTYEPYMSHVVTAYFFTRTPFSGNPNEIYVVNPDMVDNEKKTGTALSYMVPTVYISPDTVITDTMRNHNVIASVNNTTMGAVSFKSSNEPIQVAETFAEGANVTVNAYPLPGYRVASWTLNGSVINNTSNSYTFKNGSTDTRVVANFETMKFRVTVKTSFPERGYVTGSGEYANGQKVTIKAIANPGYRIRDWFYEDSAGSFTKRYVDWPATYSFNIEAKNYFLDAFFEDDPNSDYREIIISSTYGGETVGGGMKKIGSSVILTATPMDGYRFAGWLINGEGELKPDASYTIIVPSTYIRVIAKFEYIPLKFIEANPTVGEKNKAYRYKLLTEGGGGPKTFALISGTLPAGLSLAADGTLSGTPTAIGTNKFTVMVSAEDGKYNPVSVVNEYTMVIKEEALLINQTNLMNGVDGTPYFQQFTASGGVGNKSFAVTTGMLPAGLSLAADGSLSGTPTEVGAKTFTVTVTDSATPAVSVSKEYTLEINAPLELNTNNPPSVTVGTPYSHSFTATGGKAPLTYNLTSGSLPAGLTMNATGILSGTPTAVGEFTFEVTVTDSKTPQTQVSKSYTLKVNAIPHNQVAAVPVTFTPTAGVNTSVTLTVKNSDGTVDQDFTGSHAVTVTIADASSKPKDGKVNDVAFDDSKSFNLNFTKGIATLNLGLNRVLKHTIGFNVTGVNLPSASFEITPTHAAAKTIVMTNEVTAPDKHGQVFKVQPVFKLVDAFGNECLTDNTTIVTASKNDAGSWTLGGTLQKTASSGIVTFADLKAINTVAVAEAKIAFNATGVAEYVSPGMALAEKPTVVSVTASVMPVFNMIEGQIIHTPTTDAVLTLSDGSILNVAAADFASNHLEWQWSDGTSLIDGAIVAIADHGKEIVLKETVSNVKTASIPVVVGANAIDSISQTAPNPAVFKSTYEVGDIFDPNGIAVDVTYTNGQKITVAYADFSSKSLELVLMDKNQSSTLIDLKKPLEITADEDILCVINVPRTVMECNLGLIDVQPLLKIEFLNTDNISVLETVYVKRGATATATLTPVPSDPNTIFGGWSGDLTNLQSDKQFSPKFVPKPPKQLQTVDVIAPLPNLTLIEGSNLDLNGLNAKITYDDDSTKDVALVDFATDGLILNKTTGSAITLADEGFDLTISYNGSVKATIGKIHVTPNVTTSLARATADAQGLNVVLSGTDALDKVTANLVLPAVGSVHQSNITWVSSHPQYVSTVGVVTRPLATVGNTTVQLTGTANYLGQSVEKVISITVIAQPPLPPTPPTPSGGGGGGGGSAQTPTPVIPTPVIPTPTVPVTVVPAPVTPPTPANPPAPKEQEPVQAKLDQKGVARAAVGVKELKDELAEAKKSKEKELDIEVEAPKGAKVIEAKLGKDLVIATKTDGLKGLNLDTPLGDVSFNEKALKTLQEKTKGDVSVTVQTKIVNGKTMYDLRVLSGGKAVTGLGGNVEVSVPYTLKAGETAKNFKFYVADAKGKPVLAKGAVYDSLTKEVIFKLNI